MNIESILQQRLLEAAPQQFPNLRLFRRNIGEAKMRGGHTVKFAINGQADLYGITKNGRHLEIELKSAGKKLKPDQERWQSWCKEWNIPHLVLTQRREESHEETVGRWLWEINDMLNSL